MPDSHKVFRVSRQCGALALDGSVAAVRRTPCHAAIEKLRKLGCGLNLIPLLAYPSRGRRAVSNQDEINQRDQGRSGADRDQGIVGGEVGFRIERRLVGPLCHFAGLGPAGRALCEVGHI